MAKNYILSFGTGNPTSYTGLSPTMTIFKSVPGGSNLVAPSITEIPSGTGYYTFSYEATFGIVFLVDGGAALSSTDRYIKGVLDPIQSVDEKVGFSTDSFGTTATDPSSMYGLLKRAQEFNEGNANFDKDTGVWDIYSRGSSTLLRSKTLSNVSGDVTKS